MSSMFSDAYKTQINGGNFLQVAGNVTYRGGQSRTGMKVFDLQSWHFSIDPMTAKALDILFDQCAHGALIDSNERFNPPRCAEKTRGALIKQILEWIDADEETAKMLWLHGSAGTGKSALAQTIAELLKLDGRLLASFFFSRTSASNRSDGNTLIPTLIYQLLLTFPETRPHVEAYISKDPAIFQKSRRTQMDALFVQPLLAAFPSTPSAKLQPPATTHDRKGKSFFRRYVKNALGHSQPPVSPPSGRVSSRVIIIDGLDECGGQEVQIDILKVITNSMSRFPIPIRIFVASRRESYLTRFFDHDSSCSGTNLRRIDLDQDQDTRNDIRTFLLDEFQQIHRTHPLRMHLSASWPSVEDLISLLDDCSTHFIYASTVIRYISSPKDRPDKRLKAILNIRKGDPPPSSTEEAFPQLDALYAYVLSSVNESQREIVWKILGIVYITASELWLSPDNGLANLTGSSSSIEELLNLESGLVSVLLDPLASLVSVPSDSSPIKVLHASVFDHLLSVSRSGRRRLDLVPAHDTIANYQYVRIREPTGELVH